MMLPVVAASEVGSTSEIRLEAFPDSPWTSSNQIVSFHMPQTSHEMFIFSDVTVTTCIVVGVSHPIRLCIFVSSPGFQKQTCKRDVVAQGFTSVGSNLYIDAE